MLHVLNLETNEDVAIPNATGGDVLARLAWIAYQVDPAPGRGGRGGRGGAGANEPDAGGRTGAGPPGTPRQAGRHRGRGDAGHRVAAAPRRAAQPRDRRRAVVAGHSVVHVLRHARRI